MHNDNFLILKGDEVLSLLAGCEIEVMRTVKRAYEAHAQGHSSLPHSTFLRFPSEARNRIIALPAFLGDEFQIAGIKWIASFPGNRDVGLDRASAVLILNSTQTGRPQAFIEGSIISAKRTAASAALAAQCLHSGQEIPCVGLIGCGLINLEITRFLLAARAEIKRFAVFDTNPERAHQFKGKAEELFEEVDFLIAHDVETVLKSCPLISIATTAIEPHISSLSACPPGATVLHISLRDLTPEAILSSENVVDDIDHVCRAGTSVHLAEMQTGNRDFVRCTLAEVLMGNAPARQNPQGTLIFSPFGLGILDVALGKLVCDLAEKEGRGTVIGSFMPDSWIRRRESAETSGANLMTSRGEPQGMVHQEEGR